jgi:SAM-dependent methyltransferase
MVHHTACLLCSSEKISLHLNCCDHFLSGEPFRIFRCKSCGFTFTQDYPEPGDIGKYYESDEYLSHNDGSKGFYERIYRLVRKIMLHRKRSLIEKITGLKRGTILDIGSGSGHFAQAMKKKGWQVNGIEINGNARKTSISKFGLDIYEPTDIKNLKSESFDCITLWHVLEHFHDPFGYYSEIKRLLKPGGHCVTALPNCSSYDAEHYREFWAAYDVPRHLWHFNPSSFTLFTGQTGLKLEKILTLPADVFYISFVSEKYKGSSFPFLRGIVRAKFYALGAFLRKEKSSSVIFILRKPV